MGLPLGRSLGPLANAGTNEGAMREVCPDARDL